MPGSFSSARFLQFLFCMRFRYFNGSHVLQLGGINENMSYEYPQLQNKHYTGCIRNLRVDSKVKSGAGQDYHICITMKPFYKAGWVDG